ncbi:type VI secretion system baseplate subunit TssE [Aureimonas pseudogalii]|uniref:Type VI secretion system protein ImpF n=1 Tax=Aureimonas pseudogalii TaxID=1744844 RepID=A0A7W6MM38_9HYPH|nr:type VI secretion system baseplate subunit TssE [Aureimonas pseudogalii]MBB4000438.1 type VI secretion system protein ImpF [Aureimonas pseudogalii]
MSNTRGRQPVRLSVLDRLLAGDAAEGSRETLASVAAIRNSVRRDLEALFNTRPCQVSAPAQLKELRTSLLTYGLSDLQTRPMASDAQRDAFRRQFEDVIRRFEPRLRDVSVEMVGLANTLDRTLRFRIRGLLVTEAGVDTIVYDTAIDPAARNLSITGVEAGGA